VRSHYETDRCQPLAGQGVVHREVEGIWRKPAAKFRPKTGTSIRHSMWDGVCITKRNPINGWYSGVNDVGTWNESTFVYHRGLAGVGGAGKARLK